MIDAPNRYQYGRGMPLAGVDPFGLFLVEPSEPSAIDCALSCLECIAALIAAGVSAPHCMGIVHPAARVACIIIAAGGAAAGIRSCAMCIECVSDWIWPPDEPSEPPPSIEPSAPTLAPAPTPSSPTHRDDPPWVIDCSGLGNPPTRQSCSDCCEENYTREMRNDCINTSATHPPTWRESCKCFRRHMDRYNRCLDRCRSLPGTLERIPISPTWPQVCANANY
jgi:hypothetical protein